MGHGRNDESISVNPDGQARHMLEALGCKVSWKAYDEGHWYKVQEEIDDTGVFTRYRKNIEFHLCMSYIHR